MAKVNFEQVMTAVSSGDYIGFCIKCGTKHMNIEPDARRYTCKKCNLPKVFGAQEILLMMAVR